MIDQSLLGEYVPTSWRSWLMVDLGRFQQIILRFFAILCEYHYFMKQWNHAFKRSLSQYSVRFFLRIGRCFTYENSSANRKTFEFSNLFKLPDWIRRIKGAPRHCVCKLFYKNEWCNKKARIFYNNCDIHSFPFTFNILFRTRTNC